MGPYNYCYQNPAERNKICDFDTDRFAEDDVGDLGCNRGLVDNSGLPSD